MQGLQRAPLGIITLEDVLEELIGEEILDEFDLVGPNALPASSYVPEEAQRAVDAAAAAAAEAESLENSKPSTVSTPSASTTNVAGFRAPRVAQGLRAIRLASGTKPIKTKRSISLPGTNRVPTPASHHGNVHSVAPTPPPATRKEDDDTDSGHPTPTPTPGPLTSVPQGVVMSPPSTPKKRPFKSLIAGESATPGLEKRADPMKGVDDHGE